MEKVIEIFYNGIEGIGFLGCLIAVISLIVGIVFMCKKRVSYGFFTIFNGIVFGIASFLVSGGYFSLEALIVSAVSIVLLNIFGWHYFNKFSALRCFLVFLIYLAVIAAIMVAAPLIDHRGMLELYGSLSLKNYSYIVFFVCLGVWLMPVLINILIVLGVMSQCANAYRSYSNQDGINSATGGEQNIDTTSMS